MMRWLAFALLAACSPSAQEALAKNDWDGARAAAHDHGGDDRRALHEWTRARATLTFGVHAETVAIASAPADATLPIRVRATGHLALTTIRAEGRFEITLRSAGILWTDGGGDHKQAWFRAGLIEPLVGSGRAWPEYDKKTMLAAFYEGHPYRAPDPAKPDALDADVALIPDALALGPDAIMISATAEWPDAKADYDAALHTIAFEFIVPLPSGATLVERINALPASIVAHPSPIETQSETAPREL